MEVVPPLNPMVPVPEKDLVGPRVTAWVPLAKLRVAGAVALKEPVLVPPPCKLSVPLVTWTVPSLLRATAARKVELVPALFFRVPVDKLLNVAAPPTQQAWNVLPSLWMSKMALLLIVPPALIRSVPVEVNVVLPLKFSVRVVRAMMLDVPLMASVADGEIVVAPLPAIVPVPLQLKVPSTVSDPAPVNVPPFKLKIAAERTELVPGPLSVRVCEGLLNVCVPVPPPTVSEMTLAAMSSVTA